MERKIYLERILFAAVAIFSCLFVTSCTDDDEPYDHPFVYITTDSGLSRVVVNSDVNNVNTYNVYLSSRLLTENFVVNYEIIAGDGLQAGRDFEVVNPATSLTFPPGIYDLSIRIRWKPYPVDPTKDNTLTIRLTGNNMDFTLGAPGPDGLQREVVIEKRNP